MEQTQGRTKYCKYCANKISEEAVICTNCGRQVEELKGNRENIVINNSNANVNTNINRNNISRKSLNKWVALCLCLFLGWCGAHKFYEGKAGIGVVYLFTMGLFGIGWFIDFFTILAKPNTYYI